MKKVIILFLILSLLLVGCTSESRTTSTLEKGGFTDIKTGGWDIFACAGEDWFSTKFEATNTLGKRIEGTVCCGLILKSCTIRY